GHVAEIGEQPANVGYRNSVSDHVGILTLVLEFDFAVLHASYELGSLLQVVRGIPRGAMQAAAGMAHGAAPVIHKEQVTVAIAENADIRSQLGSLVEIFVVPTGDKHHQDFQSLKLVRAEKGVLIPRPAYVLHKFRMLGSQLKSA